MTLSGFAQQSIWTLPREETPNASISGNNIEPDFRCWQFVDFHVADRCFPVALPTAKIRISDFTGVPSTCRTCTRNTSKIFIHGNVLYSGTGLVVGVCGELLETKIPTPGSFSPCVDLCDREREIETERGNHIYPVLTSIIAGTILAG